MLYAQLLGIRPMKSTATMFESRFPASFQFDTRRRQHSAAANLVNTVNTTTRAVDWDDRIALQQAWSNLEKGWKVNVEWRNGPYGVGLFSAQAIPAGTLLRTGVLGVNLMQFTNSDEIEIFCRKSCKDEYESRLRYVSDYLWGFTTRGTDERGYASCLQDERHRFFGMWVPGNGLNHSIEPNTVYRTSDCGINLVALTDIESGDELYDDYRRHGTAPKWLLDFSQDKQVTLNFSGCNNFLNPGTS